MDGEGCISISKGWVQSGKYMHYCLKVEMSNTSKPVVDFMRRHFGGFVTTGKRPNRKKYFRWGVASKHGDEFLHAIYPYLVIKKAQARIAFAYRKTITRRGGPRLSKKIRDRRTKYFRAMTAQKRKEYA